MQSANVYYPGPAVGAIPVVAFGHTAAATADAAPIAAGAPVVAGGPRVRAAFVHGLVTCRASRRGVLLALAVAAAARFVADHYGAPAMLFALLFGIAFTFLATDERREPGVTLSSMLELGPRHLVLVAAETLFLLGAAVLVVRFV